MPCGDSILVIPWTWKKTFGVGRWAVKQLSNRLCAIRTGDHRILATRGDYQRYVRRIASFGSKHSSVRKAVLLVFSHNRFDIGQFPDLMTKWFGVGACQWLAASTTSIGSQRDDFIALLWWNQIPLMLLMSFLPAAFLLLPISLGTFRFGMRMLTAWRKRGVLRRELLNLAFQFSDPRLIVIDQGCNKRLDGRRHLGLNLRRNDRSAGRLW